MQCPVCDEKLREVERAGVTIDLCPGCKGIWLDRGELEKLLEIAAQQGGLAPERRAEPAEERRGREEPRHDRDREESHDHHQSDHDRQRSPGYYGEDDSPRRQRRRGSWLADILEGIGGGGD